MPWVVVDIVLAGVALLVLAFVLLRTWRSVKALGTQVSASGELLTSLTAALPERPSRPGDEPAAAAYARTTSREKR